MEKASNGQFREFVGKLLVKGNDENVAKIDKTKIQNAINSLSSAEDTVFENFVRFINNGCRLPIDRFVSRFLKKTNTIEVVKNPEPLITKENYIMDFLEPVIKREKELKNPSPHISNKLWDCFTCMYVLGFTEDLVSTIYRSRENLNHGQVLKEAERTGIKKVYTYLEALSIIRQAILNREVDQKDRGIFAYFKVDGRDKLYCFFALRHYDDGHLSIYVNEVYIIEGGYSGYGTCFNN